MLKNGKKGVSKMLNLHKAIKTRNARIAKQKAFHAELMRKLENLTNPKLISDMLNK